MTDPFLKGIQWYLFLKVLFDSQMSHEILYTATDLMLEANEHNPPYWRPTKC